MSTKIKLAHVVCVLPPYGGGLGVAAHSQAELMTEAGFDVTVFAPAVKEEKKIERKYKIDPLRSILKLGHGVIVPELFSKLLTFDIVHLHFPFFGGICPVIRAKLRRGSALKLVVTYHQDLILEGWKSIYYKLIMYFITPFLLHLADRIIVSTLDYIEDSFIKKYYFAHKDKFVEIPFAVDLCFQPMPKDQTLMQKYNFTSDDFIVIFVGGLDWAHYFKGVDKLIEAFKQISNNKIKALIVGSGNLKVKYEEEAKSSGLSSRVKFAGYVEDKDLPSYYNVADVCILPSVERNEAFGIVLIEAMACGKPILASDLRGVRKVVEHGKNGLVLEPRQVEDIVKKIELLYEDKVKYANYSAQALKNVAEKYRPEIIKKKLIDLYLKLK